MLSYRFSGNIKVTVKLFEQPFQTDKTGYLDVAEVFKLEHYVAVVRREYVESYEKRNPPSIPLTQMKKALRGKTSAEKSPRHVIQGAFDWPSASISLVFSVFIVQNLSWTMKPSEFCGARTAANAGSTTTSSWPS